MVSSRWVKCKDKENKSLQMDLSRTKGTLIRIYAAAKEALSIAPERSMKVNGRTVRSTGRVFRFYLMEKSMMETL